MFRSNKKTNGTLWGTIIGTSIGLMIGSQITPMNKRKIMRSAKKAGSNLKDMMD